MSDPIPHPRRPAHRCPLSISRSRATFRSPATFRSLAVFLAVSLTTALIPGAGRLSAAENDAAIPVAPRLLPSDALLFVGVDDAERLREDFAGSSLGRMLQDPKVRPFASDLFAVGAELFQRVGDELGVSLEELLAIPHGQVAVAMLPIRLPEDDDENRGSGRPRDESSEAIRERIERQRRRGNGFAAVLMIDAGENIDRLMMVVERLEELMTERDRVRREERVGDTTLVRILPPREGRSPIEYFRRGSNLVVGVGHRSAWNVLERWQKTADEQSLADSANFAAVMGPSVTAEETAPQITFYGDPYKIIERLIKRGGAAGLIWPIVEDLGLGKIRGVGGSVFRGGETFDDLSHLHVLIDTPRDGFFGVLRPGSGDTVPPDWVPSDVASYTTLHWRFDATVDNLEKIIDRFQGEGEFQRGPIDGLKRRFDVDLREDLIANLTGRYVGVRWNEPPARINSQTQAMALEVTDAAKMEEVFAKARAKRPGDFKEEAIGGRSAFVFPIRGRVNSPNIRTPEPSVMLLGKWFVYCDSRQLLERLIRAESGAIPRLVEEPDYALISSELGAKLGGTSPFFISFVRGSEIIRPFYEMARSEETRRFVRAAGESNPVAKRFDELLRRNELPPYEELKKYFAPGGMFGYDTPGGIHLGWFTLRPLD